jgi:cysteinyl-tRNA synthetase
MKLHNSLGGRTEDFQPLNPACAGIYVCGPTIYGDSHLGHGKSYVSFDVLVRYLRSRGMKVRYVQNITDVGHLTDDADMGEDKIQRQAVIERLEPMELVEKYTRSYFDDMDALGNIRPDISPRASGHIPEQIELVSQLLEKGHAYEAGGSVYFSVRSFPRYGALSGRKPDELISGARVEVSLEKRDPLDFALWKRAEEGHILRWRSPWGWGYPGWHLECSAMAMRYLGETIDIHGGGLENIFPHHESEIAQSECATGRTFARFWLHNNMVTVDGRKMGKSLGNFTTLKQIFSEFAPAVVRLYILRSHYRSPLDFSREGLDSARSACDRLVELRKRLGRPAADTAGASGRAAELCSALSAGVTAALDDDLNTPQAVAALFDFARGANSLLDSGAGTGDAAALAAALGACAVDVLGMPLDAVSAPASGGEGPLLGALSEARNALRRNRLFADTDRMRDALSEAGYSVRDLPDGSSLIEKA